MNLVLLFDDDFLGDGRVRLTGRRLAYVRTIHRSIAGDTLRVGHLNGRIGTGVVTALSESEVIVEVALTADPPPPAHATLLLALPRPKALGRILQGVAAMGIKRIVLLNAWRVEKSFWASPVVSAAGLREHLLLGLEQGGDTVLPAVELRPRFKPFVEDELAALSAGTRALVAHPPAALPCPYASAEPLTLAVGPEGGFTTYEVELLCAHRFTAVTLGARPLRVEHAVPALLGRLL